MKLGSAWEYLGEELRGCHVRPRSDEPRSAKLTTNLRTRPQKKPKSNWDSEDLEDNYVKDSWEDDEPAPVPKSRATPLEKSVEEDAAKSGEKKERKRDFARISELVAHKLRPRILDSIEGQNEIVDDFFERLGCQKKLPLLSQLQMKRSKQEKEANVGKKKVERKSDYMWASKMAL
ncbi:hypothetical protein DH2020_004276 [Rehmannia glutinosa]|uniref:Uncharacterized protein n=1 Tax=Rehmannia glutinosa TaxID=99300 RepID=A0ABR0XPB8_REHGL